VHFCFPRSLWTKLAGALAGHAGLAGYDIMNEPHDLGAGVWSKAAQAAVNGIRSVDINTTIYVEGTQWASAYTWPRANGGLKITDPALGRFAHIVVREKENGRAAMSRLRHCSIFRLACSFYYQLSSPFFAAEDRSNVYRCEPSEENRCRLL